MSDGIVALTVIFSIVLLSSLFAFYSGVRQKMNLEQWTVGGRNFGVILMWLLMAGEIYTTFAFLGASGWAYSRGGPTLYIIAYMVLAYVVSFYFLPQLWEVGKKFGMQTQSDFFEKRYGSKRLAASVSLIGVVFLIPYLQLQLTGLGIIVEVTSFGSVSRVAAMSVSCALVAAFVYVGGIRAVAWISVIKDILMLVAALLLGFGLPYMYFGGVHEMFTALAQVKPEYLVMPGATKVMGHAWYISTVLLTAMGFYMWPHIAGAAFSAKSADTLRRNAVIMPIYSITLPLIFFVGFTALLVIPGLKNGDLALLTLVQKSYPAWILGLVGATGALAAMVPAAILVLSSATLFAKNFFRPMIKPEMSDDQVAFLAKVMVIVITLVALYFAIFSSNTIVSLLLLGYAGVTQFFPGMVLGLYWQRTNRFGVLAGIASGIALVVYLMINKLDPFMGVNAGFFALCVNIAVTVIVSLITAAQANGFDDHPASTEHAETVAK